MDPADASIGKFISTDPLLDERKPQWANPYTYSGNNPIGLSDPSGLILDPGCGHKNSPACQEFYTKHRWDGKRWVANRPVKPPTVSNPDLKNILAGLYETDNPKGAVVGDGTTNAAVRYELRTGQKINGRYHVDKAATSLAGLSDLLEQDRRGKITLTEVDRQIANREFANLWAAVNSKDVTGKVKTFLISNPVRLKEFENAMAKAMTRPAVRGITGEKFTKPQWGTPRHVPTGGPRVNGFLRSLGRIGNAMGVIGDLMFLVDGTNCIARGRGCPDYPGDAKKPRRLCNLAKQRGSKSKRGL